MADIIPGAEPWSHEGDGRHGALVIHGFTGNPDSMRGLAEAFAKAGYQVEMPLLPGHGTEVGDMLDTRWADWKEAAESAYQCLAARADKVIVAGLSMGGTLTLQLGLDHPEIAGLVCVNPATMAMPAELMDGVQQMIDGGMEVMPGIGSDIAEPGIVEKAYPETPLRAIKSLVDEGLSPIADRYGELRMPLLLCSSPQDHVVPPEHSDHLAATYGGPVERVVLERSYHVATQDYDKELIFDSAVAFAQRVTAA